MPVYTILLFLCVWLFYDDLFLSIWLLTTFIIEKHCPFFWCPQFFVCICILNFLKKTAKWTREDCIQFEYISLSDM